MVADSTAAAAIFILDVTVRMARLLKYWSRPRQPVLGV
jgi:hypothetical protein